MLFSFYLYFPDPEEKSISSPHILLPIFPNCYIYCKAAALPMPEFTERNSKI
jgi:hypothetical protein